MNVSPSSARCCAAAAAVSVPAHAQAAKLTLGRRAPATRATKRL